MFKIYIHTTPSGKKYIGQTCQQLNRRWRNGNGYVRNTYFFRAITKYGWENITHEVLYECETLQEANKVEAELIAQYKTNNPKFGYNISGGADGKGKVAESTKQLLSKVKKGKFVGEANPNFGRKHTEAERKVMSEKTKGRFVGENSPCWGTHHTEESRKKMSIARRNSVKAMESIQRLNRSKAKKVLCVETGMIYPSTHEVTRMTGFSQGNIAAACRGVYETAYGCHWKYV